MIRKKWGIFSYLAVDNLQGAVAPCLEWRDARKKEEEIHKIFRYRNCHFEGFDGCTEFFWYTPEVFELLEDVE